mmetsp:Transcript_11553/g.26742  ORF Transcript_11553/g.26742 Transcript_11553/m.26742 type:complete len:167 (+) Transcript_11553:35-535(+)
MSARRRLFENKREELNKEPSRPSNVVDLCSEEEPPNRKKTVADVGRGYSTPEENKRIRLEEEEEEPYVPTYIYKNVSYTRRGIAEGLPASTLRTFALVEKHFVIPKHFEQNRAYGPLSGTSFEERVISAYHVGFLEPKNHDAEVEICSACAMTGHRREDCSQLIYC